MSASSAQEVLRPVAAEVHRLTQADQQLRYFVAEMCAGASGLRRVLRFAANCFRGGRLAVAAYRGKRFWWLLLGRWHALSFLFMWPAYAWCHLLGGRHELTHRADIGTGFRIVHCSLACVLSPLAVAGRNLYLTGGNVLGLRRVNLQPGAIHLGDDVMLGIGAMAIGPLTIGDRARLGAGVTVVKSVAAGVTVVSSTVRHFAPEARA